MALLPNTNNNENDNNNNNQPKTLPMTPEESEQLQLLDHDIERIRKHIPNKPYIVDLPVEPHNAFTLSSSHAFDWKVYTHFHRNEEHLHYASFLYRDPSSTLMRQTAQSDDVDEAEKPNSESLAPSRPDTPSQNQAKKKISFSAYKNSKLKSQNGTPTAGGVSEKVNMATPDHNAAAEVDGGKMLSEQGNPKEEDREIQGSKRVALDEKGSADKIARSPKRSHEEMNLAQHTSSESQSKEPPLKRTKVDADGNKSTSVPKAMGQKKPIAERAEGSAVGERSPAASGHRSNQNLTVANGTESKAATSTSLSEKDAAESSKDDTKLSGNKTGEIAASNGLKAARKPNASQDQPPLQSRSDRQATSRTEDSPQKAKVSASISTQKPGQLPMESSSQHSAKPTTPQIKIQRANTVEESTNTSRSISQPDQSKPSDPERENKSTSSRIKEENHDTTPKISSLRQYMKFGSEFDLQDLTQLKIRVKQKSKDHVSDRPSKIVKLKYAKRRSADSMITLQMRSLPNKETTAAQQSDASSKQLTSNGKPAHRPNSERDPDMNSKRGRLHSSSLNGETPRTPQRTATAASPAVSVTTPASVTKPVIGKTAKSVLNGVTNGSSSISATPAAGSTPSSLQQAVSTHGTPENAKKHLPKQSSTSSIASNNMSTTTISHDAWKAEHQRLQSLGKDLKHSADKTLNNLPDATAKPKEHRHLREVGTLTALESVISFMRAFSAEDQCHSEGYYQCWSSLPDYLRYVGERVRACQDERLYGIYMLLKGVCLSTLAARMGAERWLNGSSEKDGGDEAVRKKSEHLVWVARYTRQSTDAAKAVQSTITPEAWRKEYPQACTVKERESPIVGWMTPVGAARVGLVFLEEWAEKKKVEGWNSRLREGGEGLCAHL